MVRCEEFYLQFEKKGNFCHKSDLVVKKVEQYLSYMKRNKFGDFLISNCAIEPFIKIEILKDGFVHKYALKELRKKVRKLGARGITRRISIETINYANTMVDVEFRIKSIPDVRSRIGTFEHAIDRISYEVRERFNSYKESYGLENNNDALSEILHWAETESM